MDDKQITVTNNPVGNVYKVNTVEDVVNQLAVEWDEAQLAEKPKWWQFWKRIHIPMWKVTGFLLRALDELVQLVDQALDNGPDKKATVMDAISRLYDYVIKEAMPLWLKPFSPQIKSLIINAVISTAIDFVVNKYREGSWRDILKEEQNGNNSTETTNL